MNLPKLLFAFCVVASISANAQDEFADTSLYSTTDGLQATTSVPCPAPNLANRNASATIQTCGGGGGQTPTGTLTTNSPCSLPGPSDPSRCTVNVTWHTQYATYICLWASDTALIDCEGLAAWNTTYAYATTTATTLDLRSHPIWPTQDPSWPNIAAVIAKSTLLAQAQVYGVGSTPPPGCTAAVPQGGSISSYLSTLHAPATLCLLPGSTSFILSQPLVIPSGITIKGSGQTPSATVVQAAPALVGTMLSINGASNVSITNMTLVSNGTQQTSLDATNVSVTNAGSVYLDSLVLKNTYRMNIAVSGSNNVTVSDSTFSNMGLEAGPLGAIWINNSTTVKFLYNNITGRNNGPGGDGGIDCYGSSGVVVDHNTSVNSGESAIYPSNSGGTSCTNIKITNNTITHSNEWAVDVRGLSGAVINNNIISGSNFGAMSIWDSSNNQIESNSMSGDDRAGTSPQIHCSGVNLHGTSSGNNLTGNSGTDVLSCTFP